MKSEKAEELLYESECGYPYSGYMTMQDAEKVAELAEQETEERMRREAEEAFLSCCYCEEHQYVRKKCENCEAYKSFIQKLSEE